MRAEDYDEIVEMTESEIIDILKEEPEFLADVIDQTPAMCLAAIRSRAGSIYYVREKTPELWIAAIERDPYVFSWMDKEEQTPEICMAAVSRAGILLGFVAKQTDELILAAVRQNPSVIRTIQHPFERMRLARLAGIPISAIF